MFKTEPWTMEGFIEDLESVAQDHDPNLSAEHGCLMTAAAFLREFTQGIGLDRLRELCAAERDGQCVILPCKVGTALPDNDDPEYLHKIVEVGLLVNCNEDHEWFSLNDFYADHPELTRAEAEAALKGAEHE